MAWDYGDLRALAAWIDSDGSIPFARGRQKRMRSGFAYQVSIRVYNNDRRPLDWMVKTFGGRIHPHHGQTCLGQRYCFYWDAGPMLDAVLAAVIPYLMVRRERALAAQELRTATQERKAAIWAQNVRPTRATRRAALSS